MVTMTMIDNKGGTAVPSVLAKSFMTDGAPKLKQIPDIVGNPIHALPRDSIYA